jgi:hypothetical protein
MVCILGLSRGDIHAAPMLPLFRLPACLLSEYLILWTDSEGACRGQGRGCSSVHAAARLAGI